MSNNELENIFAAFDAATEAESTTEQVVTETPAVDEITEVERKDPETIKRHGKQRKPRVVVNKYDGMEPLSMAEANEFNTWLAEHGLCKTVGTYASAKRMRVYRKLGERNGRPIHSRDCVYVVSADLWRNHKDGVKKIILKLSKKQMDDENVVKVKEYREKMSQIEEELLLQHDIVMNWYNGKSATFKKIQHKIMSPDVLEMLNEAVKHDRNYDQRKIYLQRFRIGAQIEEMGIAPQYDWRNFDVITKDGKVVCAYSFRDMIPLHSETFKTGFFDKFGYNTEIVDSETIEKVKAMGANYQTLEAETK